MGEIEEKAALALVVDQFGKMFSFLEKEGDLTFLFSFPT